MGRFCRHQHKISHFLCNNFATIADEISDTEGITDLVLTTPTNVQGIDQKLGEDQCFQFQNRDGLKVEKTMQGLNPRMCTGWDIIPLMVFMNGARELS